MLKKILRFICCPPWLASRAVLSGLGKALLKTASLGVNLQDTDNMANRGDCGAGKQHLCGAWYVLLENWDISFGWGEIG